VRGRDAPAPGPVIEIHVWLDDNQESMPSGRGQRVADSTCIWRARIIRTQAIGGGIRLIGGYDQHQRVGSRRSQRGDGAVRSRGSVARRDPPVLALSSSGR
jgi:hypothetical protein